MSVHAHNQRPAILTMDPKKYPIIQAMIHEVETAPNISLANTSINTLSQLNHLDHASIIPFPKNPSNSDFITEPLTEYFLESLADRLGSCRVIICTQHSNGDTNLDMEITISNRDFQNNRTATRTDPQGFDPGELDLLSKDTLILRLLDRYSQRHVVAFKSGKNPERITMFHIYIMITHCSTLNATPITSSNQFPQVMFILTFTFYPFFTFSILSRLVIYSTG